MKDSTMKKLKHGIAKAKIELDASDRSHVFKIIEFMRRRIVIVWMTGR
jgi:hypothetical protein